MSRKPLRYLRNERIAAALTQADIAALFGLPWKSRVVRWERGRTTPGTNYALGLEAVYGKPVARLLRGDYDRMSREVARRARELLARSPAPTTARRLRRQRSLERIAAQ
jgi:transcriptional regulator with XRE-family HTH domain